MEKVLVTGGAGFIGSHLVENLLESGLDVVVLDNLSSGRRNWVPDGARLIEGDIRDAAAWVRALDGVDRVAHLAAMARSGPSLTLIDDCQTANVDGTLLGLKLSNEIGVKKFVYSASSTHYGNQMPPQTVNTKPDLLNPYGLTKHVGELWSLLFDRAYGLPVIALRYFNVYGPRQPRSGPYGLVIGLFLEAAAQGKPLEIHGDGLQRRDFVHVRDVAECIRLSLFSDVHGKVFNVGTGANLSILDLARKISSDYYHADRRAGDAQETLADISLTTQLLGWAPRVSLDDALDELKNLETSSNG